MSRRHRDGKECTCRPVGLCIPCSVGKHAGCLDTVSTLGCACVCALDFDGPSPSLSGT